MKLTPGSTVLNAFNGCRWSIHEPSHIRVPELKRHRHTNIILKQKKRDGDGRCHQAKLHQHVISQTKFSLNIAGKGNSGGQGHAVVWDASWSVSTQVSTWQGIFLPAARQLTPFHAVGWARRLLK